MSDLLTVPEVAAILKVTPGFVREELRRKNMRGSQLSNRAGWRVNRVDLDAYVAAKANVTPVRKRSA